MTSLKVQDLVVLTALLLFSMAPIETAVVESIDKCAEFFLQQTPPHIPGILAHGRILDQNRYKPICQTYEDSRTFVTLYDTKNKIPVFSAAKYSGILDHTNNYRSWKIEPQLENNNNNMRPVESCRNRNQLKNKNANMIPVNPKHNYTYQAGTNYYSQAKKPDTQLTTQGSPVSPLPVPGQPGNVPTYDKGHLLPYSYGSTMKAKYSTCTLTNIVPQVGTFNKGSWNRMEKCVKCVLDKYCINSNYKTEAFVVIGAQPSIGKLLNNKINIPSMLWSAFCCYSSSQNRWLASAHWGENIPESIRDNEYLQTKSLAELYDILGRPFDVFPSTQCPLSTTVSDFYPHLDNKCKCPP